MALKAVFVVFLIPFCLKVLPFNTLVTSVTERVIELVIMAFAKRIILQDVESCRLERFLAGFTNKAYREELVE
jgi:hypothetical protein